MTSVRSRSRKRTAQNAAFLCHTDHGRRPRRRLTVAAILLIVSLAAPASLATAADVRPHKPSTSSSQAHTKNTPNPGSSSRPSNSGTPKAAPAQRPAKPASPPPNKSTSSVKPGFKTDRDPHKSEPKTKATGAPNAKPGDNKPHKPQSAPSRDTTSAPPHSNPPTAAPTHAPTTPTPSAPTPAPTTRAPAPSPTPAAPESTPAPTAASPSSPQQAPTPATPAPAEGSGPARPTTPQPPAHALDDPEPTPAPDPISKADHDRVGQAIDDVLRDHGFKPYSGGVDGTREDYGFSGIPLSPGSGDYEKLAKDVAEGNLGSRSTGNPVLDAQILEELRRQVDILGAYPSLIDLIETGLNTGGGNSRGPGPIRLPGRLPGVRPAVPSVPIVKPPNPSLPAAPPRVSPPTNIRPENPPPPSRPVNPRTDWPQEKQEAWERYLQSGRDHDIDRWSREYDQIQANFGNGTAWDKEVAAIRGYTPDKGWQSQYADPKIAEGRRWDFANPDPSVRELIENKSGRLDLSQLPADEEAMQKGWRVTYNLQSDMSPADIARLEALKAKYPDKFTYQWPAR